MPKHLLLIPILAALFLFACEEEITVNLPQGEEAIVVEGYIENGEAPYVVLTRDLPYFASLQFDELQNIFVKGADVRVSNGEDTTKLQELIIPGADSLDLVIYFSPDMLGEVGKTYTLLVEAEGKSLRAETHIPAPVALDSIWFEKLDSTNSIFLPDNDSSHYLRVNFTDPPGESNYYRYFTAEGLDDETYNSSENSTFTLLLFDGEFLERIWLPRGRPLNDTTDRGDFFFTGDTVHLKWCSVDQAQYDFWTTYQENINGNSPFSPPTVVKSNVEGGIGVWGGLGALYYRNLIVE